MTGDNDQPAPALGGQTDKLRWLLATLGKVWADLESGDPKQDRLGQTTLVKPDTGDLTQETQA